jgi:hypothetical protein
MVLNSNDLKGNSSGSDSDDPQPGKFHYSQLMKGNAVNGSGQQMGSQGGFQMQPQMPPQQIHPQMQMGGANINGGHLLLQQQMA